MTKPTRDYNTVYVKDKQLAKSITNWFASSLDKHAAGKPCQDFHLKRDGFELRLVALNTPATFNRAVTIVLFRLLGIAKTDKALKAARIKHGLCCYGVKGDDYYYPNQKLFESMAGMPKPKPKPAKRTVYERVD